MVLTSEFWIPFISLVHIFTKTDIPAILKDAKEIPMRHLILAVYKSRKSGQLSARVDIPHYFNAYINYFRVWNVVYYKCKKRSAKI